MSTSATNHDPDPDYKDLGAIDIATLMEQVRVDAPRSTVTVRGTVEELWEYPEAVSGVLLDLDRKTRMTFRCSPEVAPKLRHEAVVLRGTLKTFKSKKHPGFDLLLLGGMVGRWMPSKPVTVPMESLLRERAKLRLERFLSEGPVKRVLLIGTETAVQDCVAESTSAPDALDPGAEHSYKTRPVSATSLDTLLAVIAEESSKYEGLCLARGGGSQDSFSSWNDRRVIQALIDCGKPFYLAIGHASDLTLADRYADESFNTPTALGRAYKEAWNARIKAEQQKRRLDNLSRENSQLKAGPKAAELRTSIASLQSAVADLRLIPAGLGRQAAQSVSQELSVSLQANFSRIVNTAMQAPISDLKQATAQAQSKMNGIAQRARFGNWTSMLAIFLSGVVLGVLGGCLGLSSMQNAHNGTGTVQQEVAPPPHPTPAGIERKRLRRPE